MAKKSKKAKKAEAAALEGGASPFLLRSAEIGARQETFSHPWNPNSEVAGVQMGKALGLTRLGVSIVRIPAGKESFVPHAHHREEEWLYILMGQGLALIGEREFAVGMGDFMAFPTPQPVHHLKNVGADDLVYLLGGEVLEADVVDFPTLGKTLVSSGGGVTVYDTSSGKPMGEPPKEKKKKSKKAKA